MSFWAAEPQGAVALRPRAGVSPGPPWQRLARGLVQRLGPAQRLWWGPSGLWPAVDAGAGAGTGAAPRRWADLGTWCTAHPGRAVQLHLSAWWVHELLADPALPLTSDAAVLAHAQPLLQHHHGAAAAGWALAAWHEGGRRGVSALHGQPLQPLLAIAARHGVVLRGLYPWWPQALAASGLPGPARRGEPATGRLLLAEGQLVTVVDLHRGAIAGLQQRRLAQASLGALAQAQPHWPRPWAAAAPTRDGSAAARASGFAGAGAATPHMGLAQVAGYGLQVSPDDEAAARASGLYWQGPAAALAGSGPADGWWQASAARGLA